MRTEFIYSVAALAAFPLMGNAQVQAGDTYADKSTKSSSGAWLSDTGVKLKKGKYTLSSDALTGGKSGCTLKVKVTNGKNKNTLISEELTFNIGDKINVPFTLDAETEVYVYVTAVNTDTNIKISKAKFTLNFDFAAVSNKLLIEYNKLSTALGTYDYADVQDDINTYSSYYDRILAIANANYDFYKANTESIQDLWENQSDVTRMALYSDIQNAIVATAAKELAWLDGDDNLAGLDTRYGALPAMYITSGLTQAKHAAKAARDAFEADATTANLTAAKDAIADYKTKLEAQEQIQADNEEAYASQLDLLKEVYDGANASYYTQGIAAVEAYATTFTDAADRFNELIAEAKADLAALVGAGSAYETTKAAIDASYNALKSKADNNTIINKIGEFKEQITRVVADYNALKATLEGAYTQYDEQLAAANTLTNGADDFLVTYKEAVDNAVAALKTFIEANDTKATIANLTEEALNEKIAAITDAKDAYSAQKAIYNDWKSMQTAVSGKTTALNNAKTAIDNYAKNTKRLAQATFKPTTIWATTIAGIQSMINDVTNNVNANKTDATNYKNNNEYRDALAGIDNAISALQTNANAASDIYATINGQITTANNLKTALLDPTKDPKVDITTLDVWENQVTTDAAIQARTPYNTVIGAIGGITIGTDEGTIKQWIDKLAEAVNKTAQYDPEAADNTSNILGFLNSIAATPADVLKDEIATLNAIKANYQSDEDAFHAQMDAQEIAGLKNSVNAKVATLEAGIAELQERIDNNEFGSVKGALLQQELDALTAIATTASNTAANANATKAQLTEQYNKVKEALEKNTAGTLKKAQANATEYANAFATFTARYNQLFGTEGDASTANTYNGLLKKIAEQEAAINGYANLTNAQKTTYKNNVNAVSVVKTENSNQVTYTKDNILTFIQQAQNKEELTEAEVTKYQGIISELKTKTDTPATQAQRMDNLEGQLAAIDFEAAKTAVLAKDPNQQGFYYKSLTVASSGSYLKAFNDLKSRIEADRDITAAEVTSYGNQITTVSNNVNGAAAKAEANLTFFNDQNDYVAATKAHVKSDAENWYGLDEAIAELGQDKYYSSEQANQLTTLNSYYEKIEGLTAEILDDYNKGKYNAAASANGKPATIRQEIQDLLAQYTNPVNYNSQVAADNKAVYERVEQAYADALTAYQTIANNINAYRYLKSTEMQNATAQAQTEYDALIEFLESYEAQANEIKGRADGAYGSVVSPDLYDKDEAFKGELEALVAQLDGLKTTFLNKIEEAAGAAVEASTANYTQAIAASKEKAKKFSATDDDLDFEATGDYDEIDALMDAINNADFDNVKALDEALLAAEDATNGIEPKITAVEQSLALKALKALRNDIAEPGNNLTGNDWSSYNTINTNIDRADNGNASAKRTLVNNFNTYKPELQRLKEVAEQNAADTAAKNAANGAIADAQNALNDAINEAEDFVAYSDVKAELDAIKAQLEALPEVTAANAEEVKAQAEALKDAVAAAVESLYDAEVEAITALIKTANEEYITYAANHTDAENATQKDAIDTQQEALDNVKAAVALAADKPGHKSKTDALADLGNIEAALNNVIRDLQDANDTNQNADIAADLRVKANSLATNLNSVQRTYSSSGIWNQVEADYNGINVAITELNNYINEKADNMAAYKANAEAKIEEIAANIEALSDKAEQLKSEYEAQQAAQAEAALTATWQQAQDAIDTAQGQYDAMNAELTAYGNGSKYANKVGKLQQQIANANTILTEAKAEANEKATTGEKQSIANKAVTDVNEALTNLAANCTEIIALAKAAYIEAAIAEMQDIIKAITWNEDNYTTTDKTTLKDKAKAIRDIITDAQNDAAAQEKANPTYDNRGRETAPGVLKVLSEARAAFDEAVAELKQMIKDMSLEEDILGHITGGDEITIDDIQALTNIIANRQEAQQDLDRCDVNHDGRITVTDIIWLQYYWAFGEWPDAAAAARGTSASDNSISMEATVNGNVTRLAINLSNTNTFRAFQIGLQLPAGATVVGQALGSRVESGWLMSSDTETGSVRFMTIADKNQAFSGNEGAVLYVDIENLSGSVELTEAYFTDINLREADLLSSGNATGILDRITQSIDNAGRQLYNLGGRVMNGLRKGINIIRNSDGSTQKVVNK